MRAATKVLVLSFALCLHFAADARADSDAYARLVASEKGLEAYWRFEGDLKDGKGSLAGEARGGDPAFEAGPGGGKALKLEKGRFVTMGAAAGLDLDGDQSVELWFQPRFAAPPYNPCIIAKRQNSPLVRFSVHVLSDYSQLALWNGRDIVFFQPQGGEIRAGAWHHLALVRAGDRVRMYIDGILCNQSAAGSFSLDAKGLPFHVGSSAPEGVECFEGAVDEVAVYSRALTAGEVARHMDTLGVKKRRSAEEIAAEAEKARKALALEAEARLAPYFNEEALFARGEPRIHRGDALGAVRLPVGGIGTGSVQIDGKAVRPVWQIFGNLNQARIPDSFFAIRTRAGDGRPVLKALQTEAVGPFAAMKALSFRGEYPFGWYAFENPDLPVEVRLEAFNPLIPHDLKGSSIPCAIYTFTVRNPGAAAVDVNLLAAQQNAVGKAWQGEILGRAAKGYGGNVNRFLRIEIPGAGTPVLSMTAQRKDPKDPAGRGSMALAAVGHGASAHLSWDTPEALARALEEKGGLPVAEAAATDPSPEGETLDGALAVTFNLAPGAERSVPFVLAWHFPDIVWGTQAWGGRGSMYENWYGSALDVASDVAGRLEKLTSATRLFHDTLYASNLPWWLLDRVASQLVVLRSTTCFWTKDGYFGGWEGCGGGGGCCEGNCNHVWHYAQAHARVLPELGRIFREQEFRFQAPDGAIAHRQPKEFPAFDGQCGGILASYREYCMSADGAWLHRHWAQIRKAMDYTVGRWDKDEDGVLAGPQWNTLDGNAGGSTSWLGTMYLAALAASERMALIEGNGDAAARYRRIRESGSKKQDATLFNGEYYIQIPDPEPQEDYITGCHIDQVLGQWWAHQLDLGWVYPPEHVRTALGSLFRNNFQTHFHGIRQLPRRFVVDEDPGLQMITWPKGGRPARMTQYASEVMSGFEYSAAAAMVQAGLLKEGFTVVRGASIRYDGRLRTGVDGSVWGWSGNPFCDDECGKFYARPMSIWSMLLACQGFVHEGPAGRIGFKPRWRPDDHVSFFIAAEGFGLFTQKRSGAAQTGRIELRSGKLAVKELVFALPEGAAAAKASVTAEGRAAPSTAAVDGDTIRVRLESPVTVGPGGVIEVQVSW